MNYFFNVDYFIKINKNQIKNSLLISISRERKRESKRKKLSFSFKKNK